MLLTNLVLIIFAFILIWFSSKLIISNISGLAHLLKLSAFSISFFVLGISTSMPEIFIGASSAINRLPEIFAGTLMGASIVVFLFVVPLLAILGNGVKLPEHQLNKKTIFLSVFVIFLPFIASFDGEINRFEAIMMVALYFLLFYFIEKKQKIWQKFEIGFIKNRKIEIIDILKILLGAFIIFLASQILVMKTLYFAEILKISPFLLSFLLLSFGTNFPEISIAIVSAVKKQKSIALGDYLGSAAANSLIFGVLTLFHGAFRFTDARFWQSSVIFLLGLIIFLFFAETKREITRREGFILLFLYGVFIVMKVFV